MSDQPCPTCGGTTGFVKRRGTLDVCDDPWHDGQQPKRMGENGCDCDVVWRSTYVNVCQQRDDLLTLVKRYASECGECEGSGQAPHYADRSTDAGRAEPMFKDCEDCRDIRAAIATASGGAA